ncbi:MAG TPA: ATPase, T2SS/T4P/T4SS family, partial [bacterium]|nr:ATPase, T2SS/T4P/T4SS family [bacterium]
TGSGKTTTLYSLLRASYLESKGRRVIKTIEDPIEYPMPWLVQHPVTARTPAAAILKALLRADPDWIFVGEIRDRELLEPAVQAALSGHLTLASFHAGSVRETLARLHELGIPYTDLARTVRLILSQSLVKTLCPHCRVANPDGTYRPGPGCETCQGRQYTGRLALVEYLKVEEADLNLQRAIATNDTRTLRLAIERDFLTKTTYAQWARSKGLLSSNALHQGSP